MEALLALTKKYAGCYSEAEHRKEIEITTQPYIFAIEVEHLTGKEALEFVEAREKGC